MFVTFVLCVVTGVLTTFTFQMNEKGQVIPASVMMKEIEAQIVEETGLRCCICLEGYKNQPNKVLWFTGYFQHEDYFFHSSQGAWHIYIHSQSNAGRVWEQAEENCGMVWEKWLLNDVINCATVSQGYCTVSHFNVVHFECHSSAVK